MILSLLKSANLGLAFLLELGALAAFCFFGFVIGKRWPARLVLGLGLPLLAILIWGTFEAPQATWRLNGFPFWLLQIVFFACAAVALYVARRRRLGIIFGLLFILNIVLAVVWGQQ